MYWPWRPPEEPEVLERAATIFGPLPTDLVDLLQVTREFAAGWFIFDRSLHQMTLKPDAMRSETANALAIFDVHEDLRPLSGAPQSDVLWLNTSADFGFGVEIGGPDHGRFLSPPFYMIWEWRTMAWSIADAIACTRELYEHGWFQWSLNPTLLPPGHHLPRIDPADAYEELRPIIDKWNCSPLIAGFTDDFHREPARPTNR